MDQDTIIAELIEANGKFYAAIRTGDIAGMETLWSARADVSVYHPNWPGIAGRDEVMSSWRTILVLTEPPSVFAEIYNIVRTPRTAIVFCVEDIGTARMTASNVYVREDGRWLLTAHHARPLPPQAGE